MADPMVDFFKQEEQMYLRCDRHRAEWIEPEVGQFRLKKVFYLHTDEIVDLVEDEYNDYFHWVFGKLDEDYYLIDNDILGVDFVIRIHQDFPVSFDIFAAHRNISIFRRLEKLGIKSITIGGGADEAVPQEVFLEMIDQFPNSTEMDKYVSSRVSAILRNYLDFSDDFSAKYLKYMERKPSKKGSEPLAVLSGYEAEKYTDLLDKLNDMLGDDEPYTESRWQAEILQILLLLYPKYIQAFREAPVRDSLASKDRSIDFLLVDASGYVDAVEIKKPFAECIVTKNVYRDNHVPMRELNGTVMQLEKYLYHLNRWGQQGEKKLNERYGDQLPEGVAIKVVNPSGMIIMGRDKDLTEDQRNDFEVIRRKYRHVLEIMTYDDMLRRLEVIRNQLKRDADNA